MLFQFRSIVAAVRAAAVGGVCCAALCAQPLDWEGALAAGKRALESGDLEQAERLLSALADQARQLPRTDARRAEALMTLALLYRAEGDYAKPEQIYREATPVALTAYGADSPEYARVLNEVGRYYHMRRKYEIAERFYMQAFGIRVRALGQEHPDVAESICNLAVLFENQARYAKAEVYYRTALEIREKQLGEDNPKTVEAREHFARLLTKLSKTAEAAEQLERAAAARRKLLEPLLAERVELGEVTGPGPGVEPPEIVERVEPDYTDEARIGRHEGSVALEAEIDVDGRTRNLRLVRSLGLGLDEKAIQAVRQWRFRPARRGSKKVAFRALLEIDFRLL